MISVQAIKYAQHYFFVKSRGISTVIHAVYLAMGEFFCITHIIFSFTFSF